MAPSVACKACGKPVPVGDKFCASCGTAVVADAAATVMLQQTQAATSGSTQCGKCGAQMGRDDKFCPKCGSVRLEEATVVSHLSLRNAQAAHLIAATKGEFEILQQLGTGAMGAVYLAKDISLGRRVAIKVIASNLLSDATMISRFRFEAQTVASLRHPNIVNVHAVRQSEDLHYFVMEFIDGPPLRSMVKTHAPLDVDVVQAIIFQVGSALAYAHRSAGGVIHRDVKPANIMVDKEGDAFVTDFGISKMSEAQSGLTQTGATIGTPEYMSPEQCRGDALTGSSDQYALGIVAYEMLVGHVPFTGSQYNIMVSHTSERPKAIMAVRPDCPPEVAEAVERMLAKTPQERWPDLDSAVSAMGGAPLGYQSPIRQKIKALTGATLASVPAVRTGQPAAVSGGARTLDTATSVSVMGLPSVLETGERVQLKADVKGTGNSSLSGQGVIWASTNPSIAKVEAGWVEAVSPGSVSITASAGNVASSVLLTIQEPRPAKILVRPAAVTTQRGGRISLTALVQDKRGKAMKKPVRWKSSDSAIATVSAKGEVVAKGGGPVTITAESEGATGTSAIVVEAPVVAGAPAGASKAPVPASAEAASRDSPRQPPRARPAASTQAVSVWRNKAVMAGVPLLIVAIVAAVAMMGGGAPEPASLQITSASSGQSVESGVALGPGESLGLSALVSDAEGNALEAAVGWTSADETVVTVGADGVLRALAAGSTSVTATSGSVSRPIAVTVAVGVASLAILDADGRAVETLSLTTGGRAALRARVTGTDGNALERTPSWRSVDPAIATVDASGALTASAAGSTAVEATVEGVTTRLNVTVTAPVVAAAPAPTRPAPTTTTRPATPARGTPPPVQSGTPAARPVLLTVQVGPTFATLYVDDALRGESLRSYSVELLPGDHTIRLERPGFQTHTQTVRIVAGETPQPIQVQLAR